MRPWVALKQRVTLVLMPSAEKALVAFRPSAVRGTLMTTFLWILASLRPSSIMPGASRLMTSALMGPSTIPQISWMICSKGFPLSLAMRLGFVVTPSRMPQALMRWISAMLAVSMKKIMGGLHG